MNQYLKGLVRKWIGLDFLQDRVLENLSGTNLDISFLAERITDLESRQDFYVTHGDALYYRIPKSDAKGRFTK